MKTRFLIIIAIFVPVFVAAVNVPAANAATYPLCGTQVGYQFCVFSNTPNTCTTGASIPVTNGQLPASFAGQIPSNAAYACSPDGNTYQFFDSSGNLAGSTGGALGPFSGGLQGTTNYNSNNQPLPSVCTQEINSWGAFFNTTCWGPLIASLISGSLVYVTSWILTVAGLLFNWALAQTVTQFGQFVNTNVISGINTAWSAFRDISNIVIIGMFTFIAIATILGSTDYGAKKMISRVLIVAILINFSLLFTKIIIDASNFTATQFANAAGSVANGAIAQTTSEQSSGSTSNAVNSNTSVNQGVSQTSGIAGAFMKYSGVSSFGDTATAVYNLGKNPQGSAWLGLLYGVVTALLFLIAAIVLFYGTFLLVSRALLMIFLMITASIAFASYLLPSGWQSNYGWSMWWQTLLKNAVFAPLLMMFLWVTLTIGNQFNSTAASAGGAASLGQLISSPTSVLNINALFGYIIVISLLFISFRISSSFATSIGGFDWATAVAGAPLSLGSRLTGLLGRQTLGRVGALREESLKKQRDQAKATGDEKLASRLNLRLDRSKRWGVSSLGSRDFNAMNTTVGKAIAKNAGLTGLLSGAKSVGGFTKRAQTVAKEGEKVGKELVLSSDDKKAIREQASSSFKESQGTERKVFEKLNATAEENLKVTRAAAAENKTKLEVERQGAQKNLDEHGENRKKTEEAFDKQIKELAEQVEHAAAAGSPDATRLDTQKRAVEARRDIELKQQAQNIERAKAEVDRIQGRIAGEETNVTQAEVDVQKTEQALKKFDSDLNTAAEQHGKKTADEATERFTQAASDQAATYAQRRLSNLPYALAPNDDYVAREARRTFKKGQKDKGLQERLKAWRQLDKEEKGSEADGGAENGGEKH